MGKKNNQLQSNRIRMPLLPYAKYMLHPQAYQRNSHPAAESGEDRFASGPDQFYDVCVQTDRSHCHDDEKFAEFLQRGCDPSGKLEHSCHYRSQHENRTKKGKALFQAEGRTFGRFGFPSPIDGQGSV